MPDRIKSMVMKYNGTNKDHVKDLRYIALTVRNSMIDWLRKGCGTQKFSIIDEVLKWSKVIEEATLTNHKVKPIEQQLKDYTVRHYFHEGAEYGHNYRLPNKTSDFKRFGEKKDRVKDAAMTIVLEMYSIHQESLLTEKEISEVNSRWFESQRKKGNVKARRVQREQEKKRVAYETMKGTDELYEKMLKNVNNWKPSLDSK